MIGELAFKGLCKRAESGDHLRALFITPTSAVRDEQQIGMFNVANQLGLDAIYRVSDRTMLIKGCMVYLRIAHPYLDRELSGILWDFIHGMPYVEALPGDKGFEVAKYLESRLRTDREIKH